VAFLNPEDGSNHPVSALADGSSEAESINQEGMICQCSWHKYHQNSASFRATLVLNTADGTRCLYSAFRSDEAI
jgi:hypothetical protein